MAPLTNCDKLTDRLMERILPEGFSTQERELVLERAQLVHLRAGQLAPREWGRHVGGAVVVLDGQVRVLRRHNGRQLTLGLVQGCQPFRERVLPLGLSSIQASTPSTVAFVSGDLLRRFASQSGILLDALLEAFDLQLRMAHSAIERVTYLSMRERIAQLLLALDEQFGLDTIDGHRVINLPITHNEIASMVASSRPSVATIMTILGRDGTIEIRDQRIVICDRTRLEAEAIGFATALPQGVAAAS